MYRHVLRIARDFMGEELSGHMLWIIPILVIGGAVILSSRAWQSRIARLEAKETRWALVSILIVNFLKILIVLCVVGIFCSTLLVQSGLFEEEHGQVTQRNYDAVRTKWGVPHEQHEMRVTQSIMKTFINETLANGMTRSIETPNSEEPALPDRSEATISDETFDVATTPEGKLLNPMQVARRQKQKVSQNVPQDSLRTADIEITVTSNPRRLGGAVYAGYEDECRFAYEVANSASFDTLAEFSFPLPAGGHGVFDKLDITTGTENCTKRTSFRDGALHWSTVLKAGQKLPVTIRYSSRGLEYIRYWPSNMREKYSVKMNVRGMDAKRLNFPIGGMPPKDDLKTLSGKDYSLHWDLSNAVTNLSMGIIVPGEEQPGYHIARLLHEAPLGLALLALLLIVTRYFMGKDVLLAQLGLTVTCHYLAYAVLANLYDVLPYFWPCFVISVVPVTIGATVFWLKTGGGLFAAAQSAALFALCTIGYPIAVFFSEYTGTILNFAYIAIALYLMTLVAVYYRQGRKEPA